MTNEEFEEEFDKALAKLSNKAIRCLEKKWQADRNYDKALHRHKDGNTRKYWLKVAYKWDRKWLDQLQKDKERAG